MHIAHSTLASAAHAAMVVSRVASLGTYSASPLTGIGSAGPSIWGRITLKALAAMPGVLAGAFFGALGAYAVQWIGARRQERRSAELAAHRTMFSLLQQMNTLVIIQRDFICPHIEESCSFLSIPATMPFDPDRDALDLSTLFYLLDRREGRQILYVLYMAQENYREALRAWNYRSLLHHEEAQPKLAAEGLQREVELTRGDLERIIGVRLLGALEKSTENCIRLFNASFKLLAQSKTELREYAVKRFGHDDFTDFEIDNAFGLDQPPVPQ